MIEEQKENERNKGREVFVAVAGVVLGVCLWLLVDWIIDRKVDMIVGASKDKILSLEVMITSLIAAGFALAEIMKLARVFSHGSEPETPRLRDAMALLVALAGSLFIYGAYSYCAQYLGEGVAKSIKVVSLASHF